MFPLKRDELWKSISFCTANPELRFCVPAMDVSQCSWQVCWCRFISCWAVTGKGQPSSLPPPATEQAVPGSCPQLPPVGARAKAGRSRPRPEGPLRASGAQPWPGLATYQPRPDPLGQLLVQSEDVTTLDRQLGPVLKFYLIDVTGHRGNELGLVDVAVSPPEFNKLPLGWRSQPGTVSALWREERGRR